MPFIQIKLFCNTFSFVCKKILAYKKFYFKGIEKEYEKNLGSLGCRLDHQLLFGPPCILVMSL